MSVADGFLGIGALCVMLGGWLLSPALGLLISGVILILAGIVLAVARVNRGKGA